MAPLKPHWTQPSHPDLLQVIVSEAEFTSKSVSTTAAAPFAVLAKLSFPPCTLAKSPAYSTVQIGRNRHLELNSDLLYLNHSCEPSLIIDTANMNVLAGPKGLEPGDELTFFYPSTEWDMAQPFHCVCGSAACRGKIAGAKDMTAKQLEGLWLNGHIRELKDQQQVRKEVSPGEHAMGEHGSPENFAHAKIDGADGDPTVRALRDALGHAEKVVEAARAALLGYIGAAARRGPTSRELSGEMGGDTVVV
ncbi:hypothetical protein KVR01_013387 [Diaporthe batatas]|uniref:uncharacterized protein n=1 Tax=Diaporthe batatas TaxID=748121 RepID=UPI001D037CC3|nr:uncharacterized protein KVR01_013387 [Diaporthe batatas]KAG8156782.1 hypothetical protein KVR01_013387 [Diaporthe batatas]